MKRALLLFKRLLGASIIFTFTSIECAQENNQTAFTQKRQMLLNEMISFKSKGEFTESEEPADDSTLGPNGGVLISLGDSGYYAEAYLVSEDGMLYLFPTESDKESTMEWKMEEVVIELKEITLKDEAKGEIGDTPLILKPYEEKGDTDGTANIKDYSQYEVTDERLLDIKSMSGIVTSIKLKDKEYNNLSFTVNTIY